LTFLPDDSLHGFPFAAIRHGDKYLVEQYALSITFEHHRRAPAASPETGEIMAVGVSQGSDGISPLPGTLQELAHLESWLVQSGLKNGKRPLRKLLDGAANKQTVLAGLPQAVFLHLACHGLFQQNQPDQSGLVLIPRPRQVEILSLRELSQLDLRDLRHATLSSCWSADHFILPGRWVISLPETLWRAGAQTVLACLWEVDDRLAVAFMARFYSYLDNFPRAEALRRTQLDCLQGTLPGYTGDASHPFYWAGYTLYGDTTTTLNFAF
jgi:CHAT domain-containing protein